jgi:plasmid stabilization system protein ParE
MRLSFSAGASHDLSEAWAWYNRQQPGLGAEFLSAVEPLLESIENRPLQFPKLETESARHLRYALVRRFPYRIIFEVGSDETLVVLAVAHTSRRPDYWSDRPI